MIYLSLFQVLSRQGRQILINHKLTRFILNILLHNYPETYKLNVSSEIQIKLRHLENRQNLLQKLISSQSPPLLSIT